MILKLWRTFEMNLLNMIFGYKRNKEYWIPINDVKISYEFQLSSPNSKKFRYKENVFRNSGCIGRIILDENFELIDGYCSYLICKKYGMDKVPVWFI